MKMKFAETKFYNDEVIFEAGIVYEVSEENGWADRWLRRGGIVVQETVSNPIIEQPEKVDAPPQKIDETKPEIVVHNEVIFPKRSVGRPKKLKLHDLGDDAKESL